MTIKVVEAALPEVSKLPPVPPYLARGKNTGSLYLVLFGEQAVRLTEGDGSGLFVTPIGVVVPIVAALEVLPPGSAVTITNE